MNEPAESTARPSLRLEMVLVAGAATLVGVLVAAALAARVDLDGRHLALALASFAGLGAACLAITRFWAFVLLLVACRPTLDLLDQTSSGGGLDPAAAIGVVFTGTAMAWLLVQWMQRTWTRPSGVTIALYALSLAGFASTITSSDASMSVQASFKILAGALMFGVLEQVLSRHPERARQVLLAFFASAVVPLTFGLVQLLFAPPAPIDSTLSRVHGTFVHPNPFATFLVLQVLTGVAVLPVTVARLRPWLYGLVGVSGLLLVFTYTRGAWLVLVVGIAYLGVRGRKELLVGLVVAALAVAVLVPSVVGRVADAGSTVTYDGVPANSFAWRTHYWKEVARLAPENPVTGIGLETVAERMDEGLQPHNVVVQTFVELGALGLASLLALAFCMVAMLRSRRREATGDRWRTALTDAAAAAAVATAVLCISENLLTSTAFFWALAAAMTFGLRGAPRLAAAGPPGDESLEDPGPVVDGQPSENGGARG